EPAAQWLELLLRAAAGRGAWFATGKILNASRNDEIDATYDAVSRAGCAWRIGHGRRDGPEFDSVREIRLAPATACLYRTELFRRVGLFDESFESYLEDVDFGLRCALANYTGVYVPDAVAYHWGSATLGRWHPRTVRLIARNQVLLLAKHVPRELLLRNAWRILAGQLLWAAVAARHGRLGPCCRGKLEAMRLFRSVRKTRQPPSGHIEEVMLASERDIRRVQAQTGFDWYWRLYFFLAGSGAF
ncbi:MAG: glycosyltransferase family 2 protein, partial [Acidobacteria bacterium]|nr:glycosyltransferase family 2 protein [Acidobacteriota bacterium]